MRTNVVEVVGYLGMQTDYTFLFCPMLRRFIPVEDHTFEFDIFEYITSRRWQMDVEI